MLFHLVTLLIFKNLLLAHEQKSGIITFKNRDDIIYAKSYYQYSNRINYVSCAGENGSVEKKEVSTFDKKDVCLQISTADQIEYLRSIWPALRSTNDRIIIVVGSQKMKLALESKILEENYPSARFQVRIGRTFDVLTKSPSPNIPDKSLFNSPTSYDAQKPGKAEIRSKK